MNRTQIIISHIHTIPWLISGKTPDPAEAKLTPYLNSCFPGLKYGGINGNLAYSAA